MRHTGRTCIGSARPEARIRPSGERKHAVELLRDPSGFSPSPWNAIPTDMGR